MQYNYNEKTLTLQYITIYQNDKILNSFFTRQQKYTIIISIHEVVDGNPMMYKKTSIKSFFFYKKYRSTIKIHYNYNTNTITLRYITIR